jgi:hypothetical protein
MLAKLSARRPSHGTVVAYVALFVALGGSSYAALRVTTRNVPRNALTGADIKNLTGKDVTNNSLTGADVKNLGTDDVANNSLLAADFAPGQLPTGPQGAPGAPGAPGARGERGPSDAYSSFFGDSTAGATSPTQLADQPLPAGEFIAHANFIVRNIDPDNALHSFTCGLYYEGEAGNVEPDNSLDYAQVTMDAGEQQTVSMTGPVSQDIPGAITLTCYRGGPSGGGQVQINDIDIGALQVGALH